MSADKRSVHTDALETLGTILDTTAARDAIHLAVEPCIAQEVLKPGQKVSVNGWATRGKKVGIVDPFLDRQVGPGERFWLVLMPRTVTSLRHVWEHPDFPNSTDLPKLDRTPSEQWIRNYAENLNVGYDDLIDSAKSFIEYGEYMVRGGILEGRGTDDEFWDHFEVVTGLKVPSENRENFFSCSC